MDNKALRAAKRQRKGSRLAMSEPRSEDWRRKRVNALAGFVERSGNLPLRRVRLSAKLSELKRRRRQRGAERTTPKTRYEL